MGVPSRRIEIRRLIPVVVTALLATSASARYIQADPIGINAGLNQFIYVEADPLRSIDPDGRARIVPPAFKDFAESMAWGRKYRDLYQTNEAMRRHIQQHCPHLLEQFDKWVVYVDPNIDSPAKRERGRYAKGFFGTQSSQFNKSFFDIDPGARPSQGDVFAHEFRHMMRSNNAFSAASDLVISSPNSAAERDADEWARRFWTDCECRQ